MLTQPPAPPEWRGAVVRAVAATSAPYVTDTPLVFDTIDKNSPVCFSLANPTRLTVPDGVFEIMLSGRVRWPNAGVNTPRGLVIAKNGVNSWEYGVHTIVYKTTDFGLGFAMEVNSPPFAVVPGDIFELEAIHGWSGGNINCYGWFSMTFF